MTDDTGSVGRRHLLKLAALAGVPASAVSRVEAGPTENESTDGRDRDHEVVIGLDDRAASIEEATDRVTPAGTTVVDRNETLGIALVVPPDSQTRTEAIQSIETHDEVRYATPNVTVSVDSVPLQELIEEPTDSELTGAFDPSDPEFRYQQAANVIDADLAWEATLGADDVTIAVADSGVKYDHEDLEANMDDSVSNSGKDFAGSTNDPYPRQFGGEDPNVEAHGTQVAGIAGAVTDNSTGVAGISNCTIQAVRVAGSDGVGEGYDIVDGIEWAATNGADIINLSLGAGEEWGPYDDAVSYAHSQGAMTIASAGNDSERREEYSPGSQTTMAVSATDGNDEFASFSNWGPYVDIAAPGSAYGYVETTYPAADGEPADQYSGFAGTSMSAPVVSGVAALVRSVDPELGPFEVRDHLVQTATDLGLGEEKQGGGRVDAAAAVFGLLDFSFSLTVDEGQTELDVLEAEEATITVSLTNDGPDVGLTDLELLVDGEQRETLSEIVLDAGESTQQTFTFVPTAEDDGATVTVSTSDGSVDRQLSVESLDESIQFEDQATAGEQLFVDRASLSQPFAVRLTLHSQEAGTTAIQEAGAVLEDKPVELFMQVEDGDQVTATLHFAKNGEIGQQVEIDGEPVSSTATVTVTQAIEYTNSNGLVDNGTLREAVQDWQADQLPTEGLADVIQAWNRGTVFRR